ncbi:hypothetical protein GCM10023107_32300 [Actinoplanes octamycinicus]|nr:hypothetical protein Aoc01nite_43120 [Actinoplanes octamycinicus]
MRFKAMAAVMMSVALGVAAVPASASAADAGSVTVLSTGGDYIKVTDSKWYCSSLSNGSVCIRYINNFTGVDVKYVKTGGSKLSVRFSYGSHVRGAATSPGAWQTISSGQTKSTVWNNASILGDCLQGHMETKNSSGASAGNFYTPVISKGTTVCDGW